MTKQNEAGWNLQDSYRQLPSRFYTKTKPTPVSEPNIVIFNEELAKELGLNSEFFTSEYGKDVLGGNSIPSKSFPLAQAYAGHQFGHFTMLGDGRAVLLGEQVTPNGKMFDIQLKGAGATPYSRGGDGRAALGPMLREYMISEAMHALGIPTTRSLAVATTGEPVMREHVLEGAILTRVASSHIRVGTFQYAARWGTYADLKALADYTIQRHDKQLVQYEQPYLKFLENVIERQAYLIAQWQLVGFIHGVMNTDNVTISGETIDYGPCAFMDAYDRRTVFSSIDREGRYAYGNQPFIGKWNLTRFAETLVPLLADDEDQAVQLAEDALANYEKLFKDYFSQGMRAKLGLFNVEKEDEDLIEQLLKLMETYEADYTNTFIALTFDTINETMLGEKEDFKKWYEKWQNRRMRQEKSSDKSMQLMRENNPAVIPRNYYVEAALEAAVEKGELSVFEKFMKVLSNPFAHTSEQAAFANVPETNIPYQTFCGT